MAADAATDQPSAGCVFMYRDGQRADVNENSIEIMAGLGWSEADVPAGATRADLDAALAALPGDYLDAGWVIANLKDRFEALFTVADEQRVRDVVTRPSAAKPSDGLTVQQIKDALEAKAITIPDGTTLKADLAALLDNTPA